MKSLDELETELANAQFELEQITIKKEGNSPFRPGQTDSWKSDGYSYNLYTDPDRARFLQSKIKNLEAKIKNYARDASRHREIVEHRERELKEGTENRIVETSKDIYDEKMSEYMNLNLWGKAKVMFSGKKPKRNLGKEEIVSTYSEQAVEQITSPIIKEIIHQKEEQLEAVKKIYADDPKMLEAAIRETEKYFNEEIKRVEYSHDRALNSVNGGKSR